MSLIREDNPTINVKKKQVQFLVEFCIENRIDFTIKSKSESNEEFMIEFLPNNMNKAVALGMCLKEMKLELNGLNIMSLATIKTRKNASVPVLTTDNEVKLAFESDLQFDLGTHN